MYSVSLIIVNWNGASYIEKCIDSLLELDYENFEIIVIDNNSSDNSVQLLKKQFPNLRIIINNENLGFAPACNIGIKASNSTFIGLFNSDAIADPKWLRELAIALSDADHAGAAAGPIYYYDPPTKIWFRGGKVDAFSGFSWHVDQNRFQISNVGEFDTLTGCAVLIKRSALEKIGLLDEDYFLYGEDIDFSISIRRLGLDLLFVPSAVSWHMVSTSKKKVPFFAYWMKISNDIRVILKNFPLKYLPSALLFRGIILPMSEALYFYKNPRLLLLGIKAFGRNLKYLRKTISARVQMDSIGKSPLKIRFKEAIHEAKKRLAEKRLYW
jgi:GT2 family glycosyltransferase